MQAKAGKIAGGFHILAIEDGPDEIGICGAFADDLEYAATAAKIGFNALLGHQVLVERNQLPRRLRKDYRDEKVNHSGPYRRRH